MTLPIPDNFNDPQGRWHVTDDRWDTLLPFDGDDAFLTDPDHKHVDLRAFIGDSIGRPRIQSELDLLSQQTLELDGSEYDIQSQIELAAYVSGENWTHSGAGFTAPVVDTLPSKLNWRGLASAATGSAIADDFISSMPVSSVPDTVAKDISMMDAISIIMPDILPGDFTQATSYVQLTSNPNGAFATASYNSVQVPFSSNTAGAEELRLDLTGFTGGINFTLAGITGIKIHVVDSAHTAGTRFSIMAIRALTDEWTYQQEDFNTRFGGIVLPVTLDGDDPSTNPPIPLIRGNGTAEDPRPTDITMLAYFNTGDRGYIRDNFDTNTIENYDPLDATSSAITNLSTISGELKMAVGNNASEWNIFHNDSKIVEDAQYTLRFKAQLGSGGQTFKAGAYIKYIDVNNWIRASVTDNGTVSTLRMDVTANGVLTSSTAPLTRMTAGAFYYVRAEIIGDTAFARYFTTNPPEVGAVAVASTSVSINASGRYQYVQYVEGAAGIQFHPINTSASISEIIINPTPIDDTDYNQIDLFFRETKDIGNDTASWLKASLKWNHDNTVVETVREDYDTGVTTQQGFLDDEVGKVLASASWPRLEDGHHLFKVHLVGSAFTVEIYKTDFNLNPTELLYTNSFSSATYLAGFTGRIGLMPTFYHRDAYLNEMTAESFSYATLRSVVLHSRTPVDGVQLKASFSVDENLFRYFTWIDAGEEFIDKTKTISGNGSFRTSKGVFTNQFLVQEWPNTYLTFDLWVPATVTEDNQPIARLEGQSDIDLILPKLQGNKWNSINVDLSLHTDKPSGFFYTLVIEPGTPDVQLGDFWIDNMRIGHRMVDWQVRAKEHGPWRSLYGLVNRGDGAVHFPIDERGRELQVQALALTPDAWVSDLTIHPRYAALGLPVFDQGYEH